MDSQLNGKNIIVTGSNCGIGYETALELARRGGRIILACRDEKKAQEACKKIIEETKNENVEFESLDLSKLKSIKDFAERIKSKLNSLDILINNAGLVMETHKKTEDGFETTFAVNYLGHYYLTRLLLDLIKQSAPSRIVNVSSAIHKGVKMNWDDLQLEKPGSFGSFLAYRQSKLGNILFTNELAERLKDSGVTVVSLHPGAVNTEIVRTNENSPLKSKILASISRPLMRWFGKTSAEGASTSIHCATAGDVINHSGAYYDDCKVVQPSQEAINRESAEKLWNISAQLVNLEN